MSLALFYGNKLPSRRALCTREAFEGTSVAPFAQGRLLRSHSPSVALRAPPPSRREAIEIAKAYARNDIRGARGGNLFKGPFV